MVHPIFLWNFVNLIDAEGSWFLTLAVTISTVFLLTKVLNRGLMYLQRRFHKSRQVQKELFLRAIERPLGVCIWSVVCIRSFDLVTDHILSEQLLQETKLICALLGVLAVLWVVLRWKRYRTESF